MKFGKLFFMLLRAFVTLLQTVISEHGDDEDKKELVKNGFGTEHDKA